MLNEAQLIAQLQNEFPQSIGDDAAVIPKFDGKRYVVSKDLLIEDVHFRTNYVDAASLAHKTLHVNLSDCAAMGAKPLFILLGISIPSTQSEYAKDFLDYFAQVCKKESVQLIGGDTTKSPNKFFISVTVIGIAVSDKIIYRHTAQINDVIVVAGSLGEAHIGFTALERAKTHFSAYKKAFLRPRARIEEGLWIAKQAETHSLMDISDGLYVDLQNLCNASRCAAEINLDLLNYSPSFASACKALQLEPTHTSLCGGEDYGLLITIAKDKYQELAHRFYKEFNYCLHPLGHIKEGNSVHFTKQGRPQKLMLSPFSHFGER